MDTTTDNQQRSGSEARRSFGSQDSRLRAARTPRIRPNLVVIRESDEWDEVLFDAMRSQTYLPHLADPDIRAVHEAGMAPLHSEGSFEATVVMPGGERRTVQVPVEIIAEGTTKAVLFALGGTYHLWSQSSAARTNLGGVNDFTKILISTIVRLRPRQVIAANFSRLIRSYDQGVKLQDALSGNVDSVLAGQITFDFAGPNAITGKMMFGMFAAIASMERDWIVTRLMAGRIAKWRRGEWLPGSTSVPFGYRFDPETKRLAPDASLQPAVRAMLIQLSNERVAPREMVRTLARIGVTTTRRHKRLGIKTSVAMVTTPSAFIDGLYGWAPLWIHGEHLTRFTSPIAGVGEIAGVPVVNDPSLDTDSGEFQFLMRVGVPRGGWAEPEVLASFEAAAITRAAAKVQSRGVAPRALGPHVRAASAAADLHESLLNAHAMRGMDPRSLQSRARRRGESLLPLLTGLTWADETAMYEIHVSSGDTYKLLRWPVTLAEVPVGTDTAVGSE